MRNVKMNISLLPENVLIVHINRTMNSALIVFETILLSSTWFRLQLILKWMFNTTLNCKIYLRVDYSR